MNAKEKKEKKKEHYIEAIRKKGAVRPEELEFNYVRYDYLDELETEGRISRIKYIPKDSKRKISGYTLLFMPGREYLAEERFNRETGQIAARQKQKQEPQLDFRPDIIAWYDQLSYWDEFFTPWIHSKKIMFDGRLPVENEPTYSYFKKYVESKLEKIEKTPDLSFNPFDEQDKLKKMMKKFNEIRDKILDEFKSAMENRTQDIKSILPDFNKNSKQQLLKIVFMRITYKFLNQQNFGKKLSIVIGPDKNKKPFSMTKNKNLFLGNMYKDKDIKDIINLLSEEIKKSNIITRESIAELWTMVSESQMICTRIIRILKVLQRIK